MVTLFNACLLAAAVILKTMFALYTGLGDQRLEECASGHS